ncbi:hypothetical protein [Schaalia sp. ZJ1691]|uniref:hypothetical protein n=1 Tax=Schaalia sp. ZJ1691 TaxID=2709404 RepID=UPI0013EAB516|nr:hypothetical protein [Schaalia sp. ZJ1691]
MRIIEQHDMTPEQLEIAEELERGWSKEKLNAATVRLGPAAPRVLPAYLSDRLNEREHNEGLTPRKRG